jgi:hypothetical protein
MPGWLPAGQGNSFMFPVRGSRLAAYAARRTPLGSTRCRMCATKVAMAAHVISHGMSRVSPGRVSPTAANFRYIEEELEPRTPLLVTGRVESMWSTMYLASRPTPPNSAELNE